MEYFGISKSALEKAAAATTFDLVEPTAESGVIFKENVDKNGKLYRRWTEPVTIVKCEAEDKKITLKKQNNLEITARQFYAQLRVGDASVLNKGRTIHARFNVDFEALSTGNDRSEWMNNKSIQGIQTLITAAGIKLPGGELTGEVLKAVFPAKTGTTTAGTSIIAGKRVKAAAVGSERQDGKGRQVQIEEFLPEA